MCCLNQKESQKISISFSETERASQTAMLTMLSARDKESEQHCLRVGVLAYRFCKKLEMDDETVRHITNAALLHDVGKVVVPDALLFSTEILSRERRSGFHIHSVAGENILRRCGCSARDCHAVRAHHEKWDGSGYPDGISGDGIPLAARIIAICDSVDAMLHDRRYRPAPGAEICRRELECYRGKMYDPDLTEAFLQHFEELTARM